MAIGRSQIKKELTTSRKAPKVQGQPQRSGVQLGVGEFSMDPGEFNFVERKEGRLMSVMEPGDLDIVERRSDDFTSRSPATRSR